MEEITIKEEWYENLLEDLKRLEFTGIVLTKWNIGNRIKDDFEKFGKPEYGSKRIENLAKDLKGSTREIQRCLQFATKYPELTGEVEKLSWHQIANDMLPERTKTASHVTPSLPEGKYSIIYADPAWNYYGDGYKNQNQHYDTMSIDAICNLSVKDLADDNCILFLWVTFPILQEAFKVIEKWGFEFSTVGFNWVKSNKNGKGFFFGLGNWTRANAELCLIATKGGIERKSASISQIIYEPVGKHSEKPAIVRDKIVELVGDLPRIELFARQKTEGWISWGDQIESNTPILT